MTLRRTQPHLSRRALVGAGGGAAALTALERLLPGYARTAWSAPTAPPAAPLRRVIDGVATFDLTIGETPIQVGKRRAKATTINGTVPGPLLRFRQGEETVLRVKNQLREDTSIHWHGLLVPPEMDGVPGISFPGIRAGQTFEYRFRLKQYGTYWYHSHSALQEQLGHYGPLVIDPADEHPYQYDRQYFVVLSDWTFENPYRVLARLKKQPDYYNFQKRTVFDFFSDVGDKGFFSTVRDRWMWARMRMNPTDISDVTGATYTYLMNGLAPDSNWTGLFRGGERVLLHFINAAADSFFDVRIPGLPMTVVQSNGQNVQPVETDELRIAIAETYSVVVRPAEERAYTVFAESMDRSGYARGTLAPRAGMSAAIPPRRKRPVLSMADMGMDHGDHGQGKTKSPPPQPQGHEGHEGHGQAPAAPERTATGHEGHEGGGGHQGHHAAAPTRPSPDEGHAGHGGTAAKEPSAAPPASGHEGHAGAPVADAAKQAVAGAIRSQGLRPPGTLPARIEHERNKHGPGNAMVPTMVKSRLGEPGVGLGSDGWRVLVYTDLRALDRRREFRAPTREIEMHLTGNMERFMWSIDGVPFEDSKPVRLEYNERVRLTMVNDTMMSHPMHLHGMFMELENGHGDRIPFVHTVDVKPAERLSLLITADAPGKWAFHCHVLYHMEVGMFRVFEVSQPKHDHLSRGEHHGK